MSFLRSAEAVCVLVNNSTVLIVLNMETQRVTSNKKQHVHYYANQYKPEAAFV